MHPDVEEAIDQIDAAVFSGDTFADQTSRKTLREMLARWERGLVSFDEADCETGPTVKCRLQIYDPAITEAPFEFITKGEFECVRPEIDNLGQLFYENLHAACVEQGHSMQFYSTSSDDEYDYDVTVRA